MNMDDNIQVLRKIVLSNEFSAYYNKLPDRVRDKYDYAINIIKTQKIVSTKFVKKIIETEFYEVRISVGFNEYRTMLVATDNINFMQAEKVVLLNSFIKKDERQYKKEIKKAEKLIIKESLL